MRTVPCFLLAVAFCLSAGAQPVTPKAELELFNGKDLAGWKMCLPGSDVDPSTVWSVADGVITCTGKPNGYIRTETDYADYVLHVEWRWTDTPGNSGVLLHITGQDRVWPKSIEGQLQAGNAGDFYSIGGATMKELPAEGRRIPKIKESSEKPAGEWNRYEITCKGDTITLIVNGVLQNKATQTSLSAGKIGLQSEGAPIQFRNIRLMPLK